MVAEGHCYHKPVKVHAIINLFLTVNNTLVPRIFHATAFLYSHSAPISYLF